MFTDSTNEEHPEAASANPLAKSKKRKRQSVGTKPGMCKVVKKKKKKKVACSISQLTFIDVIWITLCLVSHVSVLLLQLHIWFASSE